MVQECHALEWHFHYPTFINKAINLLATLIRIIIDHQAILPGCRFPVDGSIIISPHIFLDLFAGEELMEALGAGDEVVAQKQLMAEVMGLSTGEENV